MGPVTQDVTLVYDAYNRWIAREVDVDGDGPQSAETTRFVYDGSAIVLQFDDNDSVTHRYFWGAAVDQIFADEDANGDVLWPLADHQGTIRDLLNSDGTAANHITYDSYGNVTSETAAAVDHLFGYTGRAFDESIGLQNNLNRWYDAQVGRWASEDPIGFDAGDSNLFRYVENSSINATDPNGKKISIIARQFGFPPNDKSQRSRDLAAHHKKAFEGNLGIAHFFIMVEKEDGSVHTFSYHPNEWAKGDPLAPFYKIRVQKDNLLDSNEPRPARVWKDDPADINLSIAGVDLAHKKWTLDEGYEKDDDLLRLIQEWIDANKVGQEVGKHIEDPTNRDNTISRKHVPNTGDVNYWVYGQNCGWWSSEMLTNLGLWPSVAVKEQIGDYNMGVGPYSRYSDNEVLRARYGSQKSNMLEGWKRMFGRGSMFPSDLRPEDVYPIKIEPGPYGVMRRVR